MCVENSPQFRLSIKFPRRQYEYCDIKTWPPVDISNGILHSFRLHNFVNSASSGREKINEYYLLIRLYPVMVGKVCFGDILSTTAEV